MIRASLSLPVEKGAVPGLLRTRGISPTAQRVEIAGILLAARQHVCAEQILTRLDAYGAAVSKATVYNTLGLFAERGLVRQVIVDPAKVFYDSNVEAHHHFYNVDDGALTDVDVSELPIEQLPKAPAGTVAEAVDIVIRIRNIP
ncbi:MAG: Fur family transcriptional regulator [Gammaproteobacteria bacterium]|jgi:Fur family iron response transcriptional regulator|nr:Fur family transcriptional regulator [Gammaproteobacteria bacterium]HJP36502.1 Fur family transcriptional regulator [Gammaproteobacteria bacterium]